MATHLALVSCFFTVFFTMFFSPLLSSTWVFFLAFKVLAVDVAHLRLLCVAGAGGEMLRTPLVVFAWVCMAALMVEQCCGWTMSW